MRAKISAKNINFFLRGEYGFTSTKQFFQYANDNSGIHERVTKHIIKEFTAYQFKNGTLTTYNPYTDKYESLSITSVDHIKSKEDLLKELSMLHKTRMKMLEQSRERILHIAKTKKDTRDKDLAVQVDKKTQREEQLKELSTTASKNEELEL